MGAPESQEGPPAAAPMFVVGIAASAGGLQALLHLISALPAGFPAAILVIQHLSPDFPSRIAGILQASSALHIEQAEDGVQVQPGTVYIAPPNWHLLISAQNKLVLTQSERVHYVRPSADVLFQSLAEHVKSKAIVIVLTGTGQDGAEGVRQVKANGGTVIAQNRESSEYFGMPEAAIRTGNVDFILALVDIPERLLDLVESHN